MVEAGSQVGIEYTLTLEDGTRVDSNVGAETLRFEQGSGHIIPGLDSELIDVATLDFNHPLAGQTLVFDAKVLELE